MMRTLTAAAVLAAAIAAPAVVADEVDCPDIPSTGGFPDGTLCESVPLGLDDAGMPRDSTELSSNSLLIDPSGAMEAGVADLTFTYIRDDGDFEFCFGFCDERDIESDLLLRLMTDTATEDDRFNFAEACILGDNTVKVFADMNKAEPEDVDPVVVNDYITPANPIYWIIPDAMMADFMDATDRRAWFDSQDDMPLFSLSGANPEDKDQLVVFTSGEKTAFFWEDITRKSTRDSDEDFGDLVFSVDARLDTSIPDGCPAGCTSDSAIYTEGTSAAVSSEGNCACLSFLCPDER